MPATSPLAENRDDAAALRNILGSKWSIEIIQVLARGPRRRMEIWSAISRTGSSYTSRTCAKRREMDPLDRALDRLVRAELVDRREVPGVFPRRVVYAVAPEAEEMVDLLVPLVSWTEKFVSARRRASQHTQRPT